jgi:hypothetical protein
MPIAAKPLFSDPIYDGAADPVVIWSRPERKWLMFYTNRRASMTELPGVAWLHGTRIGIAESADGATWAYRGVARIDYGASDDAHWAPDIIEHGGRYHMFLTHVPGIHVDWSGTRDMLHLISDDLLSWSFISKIALNSDRVIDASVIRLTDGRFRMWYNDEPDNKAIRYADSDNLYTWQDVAKVPVSEPGEGPKVFRWRDRYWMIVDHWKGQGVYHSPDATDWTHQPGYILEGGAGGTNDATIGRHADVVVNGDRAYVVYFTHPGRTPHNAGLDGYAQRRSVIDIAELKLVDGRLSCDPDAPVDIDLRPHP